MNLPAARAALLALAGTLLLVPAPTPPLAPPTPSLDRLLGGMARRLQVQHEVARWKWARGLPVEDPARERVLLDRVASQAPRHGLDPGWVRAFFAAQVEAGKQVQRADFRRWRRDPPVGEAPAADLAGLRRRLDELGDVLLGALAGARDELARPGAPDRLRRRAGARLVGPGIDGPVREAALAPLLRQASGRR